MGIIDSTLTISVTANSTSGGQGTDFSGWAGATLAFVNDQAGVALQYALDGVTWQTIGVGASVTFTAAAPSPVRLRKTTADNFPVPLTVDVDAQDGVLTPAQVATLTTARQSKRVARMFFSRMGTVNNTTQATYHVAAELQQHFDAISLVIANTSATNSPYYLAKLSVSGALGDGNNSAGTWVNCVDDGNDTAFAVPVAPAGSERIAYRVTRPIQLRSVTRTDGGIKPLVFARLYCVDASATLPAYGNGTTDVLTAWATRTDGRLWLARNQAGDFVTTPATFTSTTNVSQSPVIGFVYWARGAVVGFSTCGDSVGNGQGAVIGEGWAVPMLNALAAETGVPCEYSNFSWAGQESVNVASGAGFYLRALDILRNDAIRPDVLMLPTGSFNPIGTTLNAAFIDKQVGLIRRALAEAAARGTRVMLYTWAPVNTASFNYGATDALRVAYNAESLSAYSSGVRGVGISDNAAAVSGTTSGGQVQFAAGLSDDNTHPNDAGNALIAAAARPVAKNLLIGGV